MSSTYLTFRSLFKGLHFHYNRNPYAKDLKEQITLRLDQDTLAYFKALAAQNGVPYQTLINLYLRDCATSGKKLVFR